VLSAAEFGLFSLAVSSIAIAQVSTTGGIRAAVHRFGSVYAAKYQTVKISRLIWKGLGLVVTGLVVTVSALLGGMILLFPNEVARTIGADDITKLLPLVALGVPSVAVAYLFAEVLRSYHLVVRFVMLRRVVGRVGRLIPCVEYIRNWIPFGICTWRHLGSCSH